MVEARRTFIAKPSSTVPGSSHRRQKSGGAMSRLAAIGGVALASAGLPVLALDSLPPDLQRAEEMKLVIEATVEKLQGLMIVSVERTPFENYLVWTGDCELYVTIHYDFNESDPLSPPAATAEVGELDCSGM